MKEITREIELDMIMRYEREGIPEEYMVEGRCYRCGQKEHGNVSRSYCNAEDATSKATTTWHVNTSERFAEDVE